MLLVEVGEAEVDAGFVEVDRTEVSYMIEEIDEWMVSIWVLISAFRGSPDHFISTSNTVGGFRGRGFRGRGGGRGYHPYY